MAFCSIRNNMRKLRFNRGEMTQQELAKNIGVSRQTIIAIEAGNTRPPWSWLLRLQGCFKSHWKRFSSMNQRNPKNHHTDGP